MYMTQTYAGSLQLTAFYCKFFITKDYKVQQHPINERINFLLKSFKLSARAFSEAIGEKPTITQNYVGTRNSMPGADYLEKVLKHFESINPAWFLTGTGDPFLPTTNHSSDSNNIQTKKNYGNIAGTVHGDQTQNSGSNRALLGLEKELESTKRENELLKQQLTMAQALIAAKEETITLLRGSYRNPN